MPWTMKIIRQFIGRQVGTFPIHYNTLVSLDFYINKNSQIEYFDISRSKLSFKMEYIEK